jgi:mannose-6-phosphate isomerase-like protein (cupin superfamily)
MPNPNAPFAVLSGEGTPIETPTGGSVYIKANTRNTNGSLTALHTHLREDELWYVLEGDFRFKAGDAIFRASKGGMAFGPRGTPHCFQNVGDAPARLLVITTPSGLERFFEEYAELLPGPVDPEMLSAVGHANWVEFVGPPLGVSDPL